MAGQPPLISARGCSTWRAIARTASREDPRSGAGERKAAQRNLRSYGYTVVVACTGARALRLVTEHPEPIDLVATDVVMPEMSGNALVEQLEIVRPGVPVLFMSGYTNDEVVRRGLSDGRAAFLQKPFTLEQLAFQGSAGAGPAGYSSAIGLRGRTGCRIDDWHIDDYL